MNQKSIVLVPGFMCDARVFTPQVLALTAVGFDCLVGNITNACSVERMAAQILRAAPKRFAIAGHSLGGVVALEAYRQAPDRITHIALLNVPIDENSAPKLAKPELRRVAEGHIESVMRETFSTFLSKADIETPELLQSLIEMGVLFGKDVYCRQSIAMTIYTSFLERLEGVLCPTLVLAGADDQHSCTRQQERLSQRFERGSFQLLENCSHLSTLDQPEKVSAALVDLLDRRPARATKSGNCELTLVQ